MERTLTQIIFIYTYSRILLNYEVCCASKIGLARQIRILRFENLRMEHGKYLTRESRVG